MDRAEVLTPAGRKEAFYFGSSDRPLFGFYHPPAEGAARDAAVLLCPPIGTDLTRSERTYRHLAERMARCGFACLRFDLFGTGDSGGDEHAPELVRSWREDVALAARELARRSGARKIVLFGLRLGATLATVAAADEGGVDGLVLWSPCISGASFLSEVAKLHKVYARIEPHLADAPAPPAGGQEALGAFIPDALGKDLASLDIRAVERRPARQCLVIDGGNLPDKDALFAKLQALGVESEVRVHPGHKFLVTVPHRAQLPDSVIDSIAAWLEQAYPTRSAPQAHGEPHGAKVKPPAGERPIAFGGVHTLFGILTPADPSRAKAGRPPIVLTNAGSVNRVGPHRTYVKMARRWASLGYDVLRMDLSGIGDSPAAPHVAENLTYPPTGMDDIAQAFRALGADRVIVCGLCSGGDYAFQMGAQDPRVVGAWMLNPRTFCVLDLASVESGTPPTTPVEEVPKKLRAMAQRGVDALLVVSRADPGVAYVDVHAAEEMRALGGLASLRRVDLDGTDHTFTPVGVQTAVSDLLTDHLAERP